MVCKALSLGEMSIGGGNYMLVFLIRDNVTWHIFWNSVRAISGQESGLPSNMYKVLHN